MIVLNFGAFGKSVATSSAALDKTRKDLARMEGLQYTDIVIGKNGQFTLAGLERLELSKTEEELSRETTQDNTVATQNLNDSVKKLTETIACHTPTYSGAIPNNTAPAPTPPRPAPGIPRSH